jgi:hypothetical protein
MPLALTGVFALVLTAASQGTWIPYAATQTEANEGKIKQKYVSPATLDGWEGRDSNVIFSTNGVALNGFTTQTNGFTVALIPELELVTTNGSIVDNL